MVTMLDKFGRVVIPKKVRDDLGLEPGMMLNIKEEADEIVLSLQSDQPEVVLKEGILVYTGKVSGNIEGVIKEGRQKRLKKISKMP